MRPDKSTHVLLLNIVLNFVTCVFSTYCSFVQTVEYHKVFEMNLGNEPFLCIPLWHFFKFLSLPSFKQDWEQNYRKITGSFTHLKFSSTSSSSTLNCSMAGNVRFGHLRGKDRGLLKSMDHFSKLHGNCQHSDVDLLLFPRRIFKILWLESQSLVFLFYETPSNSHFPPIYLFQIGFISII